MTALRILIARLAGLFRRRRAEQGFREEIEFHIQTEVEHQIRLGLTDEEAVRVARRKFGNIEHSRGIYRETHRLMSIEAGIRDLRLGMRTLAASPSFTIVTILTLALGIGATTTVFSVADPLLTRPLPVRDPGDLVLFRTANTIDPAARDRVPQELYERLLAESQTLSAVMGFYGFEPFPRDLSVLGGESAPVQVLVEPVTGAYFPFLGIRPAFGRLFSETDDTPGEPLVAVISHGLWKRVFGGDPGVIGTVIQLEELVGGGNSLPLQEATVVGVAPPDFHGVVIDADPDVWLPFETFRETQRQTSPSGRSYLAGEASNTGGRLGLRVMGRRRRGVGFAEIQTEIDVFTRQLSEETGAVDASGNPNVRVEPGATGYSELRLQFLKPLQAIAAATALVLLIVCANVAGLVLMRGSARRKEVAVRLAIGSGRLGVIRQMLAEGVILAAVGGLIGLIIAYWGVAAVKGYSPSDAAVVSRLGINTRVLGFTAAVSLLSVLLCALLPALRISKLDPNVVLTGSGSILSRPGSRVTARKMIVAAQVALSLVLLVNAGLFLRTVQNLRATEPGFDMRNVITFSIEAPGSTAWNEFRTVGLDRLESLPGVVATSFYGTYGFFGGDAGRGDEFQPRAGSAATDPIRVSWVMVGPDFFETAGIPLLSGREFIESDLSMTSAAVLSESLATTLFGDQDPVGQNLGPQYVPLPIVGIAGDAKHDTLREGGRFTYYRAFPVGLGRFDQTRWILRTEGDAARLAPTIRSVIEGIDSDFRVADMYTLYDAREASITSERLLTWLVSVFGFVALVLVSIGVYGLLAYAVIERTGEIGIRMALGAQARHVVGMVMRETTGLLCIGGPIGLLGAFASARIVSGLLFGVTPLDTLSIAAGVAALLVGAGVGAWLPARRASRIDPIVALQHD